MKLITDLATVQRLAARRDRTYGNLRAWLKGELDWSDAELDCVVHEIARPLYEAIDCTACANCCRTMHAGVRPADARRLAKHLGLSEADFADRYLAQDWDSETVIEGTPCAFLCDSLCSVYEQRPEACRTFPHLLKSGFRQRLLSVWSNASECPIVLNTLERLIPVVGYRGR